MAEDGTPPLMVAAAQAALEGSDVAAVNQAGDTALHTAASRGYVSVVQLLAARGAKLDVKNKRGQTPLMMTQACRRYCDDEGEPPPGLKATTDLLRKLGATEAAPSKAAAQAPKNP